MEFGCDESGGFDLARNGFELSLWSTVVCPPGERVKLANLVEGCCERWGVQELHATSLDAEQKLEVALGLSALEIVWTATVIDSEIMTADEAETWRNDQIAKFLADFDASENRGSMEARYVDKRELIESLLTRTKLSSFVQYGIVAPTHIHSAVQAALLRYRDARWNDDWRSSALNLDRKDLQATDGEKLIKEILLPILASRQMTLDLPPEYLNPKHPIAQFRRGSGVALLDLLGESPRLVDSADDVLVQCADVAGWLLRRRITHPHEAQTEAAFNVLKLRMYRTGVPDLPFKLVWRNGRQIARSDLSRYQHLLNRV